MNRIALKKKISRLETELEIIKTELEEKPDFDIDEKNWQKVKPESRKARKELYRKLYGKA
ncbi:MAG: hypothetical protein HYW79_02705 [Parcubacteria group bacterium]|nr:hypothetical protein [Parcubacteria group bacterium]